MIYFYALNIANHQTLKNKVNSNVKLLTKWEGLYCAEAISKLQFKCSTILEKNFIIIELNIPEIYSNKPIFVGMCILDISKLKIYSFHYEFMKNIFKDKDKVSYTDTDSVI